MDVQCYELFGGIALKNHTFSFSFFSFSLYMDVRISTCARTCEMNIMDFY